MWKKLSSFHPAKHIPSVVIRQDGLESMICNPNSIVQGFQQCWKGMYKFNPSPRADPEWTTPPIIPQEEIEELTAEVTVEEYNLAMQNLTQGSPGSDGVDTNIIKALPPAAHNVLHEGMSALITQQLPLPKEWHKASIMLLPKEGLTYKSCTNYTLVSSLPN